MSGEHSPYFDLVAVALSTPLDNARFALTGVQLSCPVCKARWSDSIELRAAANPFLADRVLLVTFCRWGSPCCTSYAVLAGDMKMRQPIQWEAQEIQRTTHIVNWRKAFVETAFDQSSP